MLNLFFGFLIVFFFILTVWVYWVNNFKKYRESLSSFECGFDSKDKARLPFSLRFFSILIIFVVFDLEICLLLQLPYDSSFFYFKKMLPYALFFLILVLGVLEELRRGLLKWFH